jgi:hypothetical protein
LYSTIPCRRRTDVEARAVRIRPDIDSRVSVSRCFGKSAVEGDFTAVIEIYPDAAGNSERAAVAGFSRIDSVGERSRIVGAIFARTAECFATVGVP